MLVCISECLCIREKERETEGWVMYGGDCVGRGCVM